MALRIFIAPKHGASLQRDAADGRADWIEVVWKDSALRHPRTNQALRWPRDANLNEAAVCDQGAFRHRLVLSDPVVVRAIGVDGDPSPTTASNLSPTDMPAEPTAAQRLRGSSLPSKVNAGILCFGHQRVVQPWTLEQADQDGSESNSDTSAYARPSSSSSGLGGVEAGQDANAVIVDDRRGEEGGDGEAEAQKAVFGRCRTNIAKGRGRGRRVDEDEDEEQEGREPTEKQEAAAVLRAERQAAAKAFGQVVRTLTTASSVRAQDVDDSGAYDSLPCLVYLDTDVESRRGRF